ncbi:MAG: phosphomannomutase/phosphoglucomutase [Clostridia bacterium]|nr:phosphomannomutase/phosphoglucomutase [Clostridia bacterium]
MLNETWKHLKSGTDIRGVALEGVEGQHVDLGLDTVSAIGKAFAVWLTNKTGKSADSLTVSIGRDSRLSGPAIMQTLEDALVNSGINVINCSLASTPAMFMTTVDLGCDGAIQITASHHPWNRNGLKFFLPEGGLESSDIGEILELAQDGKELPKACGKVTNTNYMDMYAARLRKMIEDGVGIKGTPLDGFHIVVDAGNGAGGFYEEKVLRPLGANTDGSQFLEPDGHFPNHIPNPENKEAMESACAAVKKAKADLGIIFDTDVDRAGCVDEHGKEINRNRLIALASVIALEGNEGGTIVTDSITSSGLKTFIEKDLHGKHLRFKRGYRNVINESLRLNKEGINSPLAIETSGHAALRENYFLDDGAYLVTKIVIKAARLAKEGKKLEDLISTLAEPKESVELRFNITEHDFKEFGQNLLSNLETYSKENGWDLATDSHEGVRVAFGKGDGEGWFLLRLSVHDPVMPLNIESDTEGGCKAIAKKLAKFLDNKSGIDVSSLNSFLA